MQPQTIPPEISPSAQRPSGRIYHVTSLVWDTWTLVTMRIMLDMQALVTFSAFSGKGMHGELCHLQSGRSEDGRYADLLPQRHLQLEHADDREE